MLEVGLHNGVVLQLEVVGGKSDEVVVLELEMMVVMAVEWVDEVVPLLEGMQKYGVVMLVLETRVMAAV